MGAHVRERELRRRCRRLLRDLDIQPPLEVSALCEAFGRYRGTPIRLVSHPMPMPGPFGVWIRGGLADYIFYQQETTSSHQDHIILHEIGHMMAGHESDEQDDELLEEMYPNLDPGTIRLALRRTHYDTEREREAEMVATIILQWASVIDHVPIAPSTQVGSDRIEVALGDRLGWL